MLDCHTRICALLILILSVGTLRAGAQTLPLAEILPQLLGNGAPLSGSCEFDIAFVEDQAVLTGKGECGAYFDGSYARTPRD